MSNKFKGAQGVLLDTMGRRNRKIPDISCEHCGKVFRPISSKIRTCSRACGYEVRVLIPKTKNKGKGSINKKGYREIQVDGKKCKEHRVIMERHLGRKLLASEDVHHINGIKHDNRIENLQVIPRSEHTKITNQRPYKSGYKMNLSDAERKRRSDHLKMIKAKSLVTRATTI